MDHRVAGRRLWRNREFNIFWSGQALSALGDSFGFLALPLLVLQATGSVAQMGLVTGIFGAGQLVSGIFSGAIVDRVDRRKLMIGSDLARAFLYGLIPLAWGLYGPQLGLLYIVTFLGAALGNTFQVANITALTNLVDKEQITDANARLQGAYAVMFLVGPTLAGFISQQFGPAAAIGIDAFSFILSAVSLLFIRLRRASAARETGATNRMQEALAGFSFLWRQPLLRWVSLLLMVLTFIGVGALDLLIFHLKNDLGQNDNAVGLVFGISSLGSMLGAFIGPGLRRKWGFAACWLGASFLQGLALLLVAPAVGVLLVAALFCVFNLSQTIQGLNSMSLRQEITPDHLLGRVTAAFWLIMTVPGPIGAAIATAIAERLGAPAVIMAMGVGIMVVVSIGLLTPIRGQDNGKVASARNEGQQPSVESA